MITHCNRLRMTNYIIVRFLLIEEFFTAIFGENLSALGKSVPFLSRNLCLSRCRRTPVAKERSRVSLVHRSVSAPANYVISVENVTANNTGLQQMRREARGLQGLR